MHIVLSPVMNIQKSRIKRISYRSIIEELLNLHRGQGLELIWRDSLQCPTEEEYIDVVDNSKSILNTCSSCMSLNALL